MIRPYQNSDLRGLAALLINASIKKTFMIPDFPSNEVLNAAMNKLFRAFLADEHFERGVFLKDTLIGFVNDAEIIDNEIEIGCAIHPDYHNHGYATEMFRAVIQALLKEGCSAVTAGTCEQNAASIRVMQKCGLTKVDKEEDIFYRGKMIWIRKSGQAPRNGNNIKRQSELQTLPG